MPATTTTTSSAPSPDTPIPTPPHVHARTSWRTGPEHRRLRDRPAGEDRWSRSGITMRTETTRPWLPEQRQRGHHDDDDADAHHPAPWAGARSLFSTAGPARPRPRQSRSPHVGALGVTGLLRPAASLPAQRRQPRSAAEMALLSRGDDLSERATGTRRLESRGCPRSHGDHPQALRLLSRSATWHPPRRDDRQGAIPSPRTAVLWLRQKVPADVMRPNGRSARHPA